MTVPEPNSSKKCERKKTNFKCIKQVLNAESQISYLPDAVLYSHLNAPPCVHPPMKVSDLSGMPTTYTDPSTKLNYATCSEFRRIRYLPQHVVNGYLALKGVANT
ncbi:INO80 complex subunit C [Schistosoma japonicum]|uniref:INO80 complex subunit C n=1 Tax=Schistosoma japonicum TaxID=6182 RepID=A0A4Z2D1P6_SCHJA|nr:INO80 complex subunit C [Schistosoma japonicum]TNN10346.1 INO80 complex subunit C [Schistosoma japonicum]